MNGFAQLDIWEEKKIIEEYETPHRKCIPEVGLHSVALGFGQTGGNGQIVSFQFPIEHTLFFQPYLLWYFSNYNKFAFF